MASEASKSHKQHIVVILLLSGTCIARTKGKEGGGGKKHKEKRKRTGNGGGRWLVSRTPGVTGRRRRRGADERSRDDANGGPFCHTDRCRRRNGTGRMFPPNAIVTRALERSAMSTTICCRRRRWFFFPIPFDFFPSPNSRASGITAGESFADGRAHARDRVRQTGRPVVRVRLSLAVSKLSRRRRRSWTSETRRGHRNLFRRGRRATEPRNATHRRRSYESTRSSPVIPPHQHDPTAVRFREFALKNVPLTVGQLAGFLQHRLFRLFHDDRFESSVVHERTSPGRISVLKSFFGICY